MKNARCKTVPGLAALVAFGLMLSQPAAAQTYTITDLGTLGGATSQAWDINNSGQVVGTAQGAGGFHAFLWQNNLMTDLTPREGTSYALGINDAGSVVGTLSGSGASGFVYANGTLTRLPGLDRAEDINHSGQIVGPKQTSSDRVESFLLTGTTTTNLGQLNRPYQPRTEAYAINKHGHVVGSSLATGNSYMFQPHAFLYKDGVMRDLGTLGGWSSIAHGINDGGQVVGMAQTSSSRWHAFVSDGQPALLGGISPGMIDLSRGFHPDVESIAWDINNLGQIVGSAWLAGPSSFPVHNAFIYSGGLIKPLQTLIASNSGWMLEEATGINDGGQIVGWGIHNGVRRAFLLTPGSADTIPPVTTATLFGATGKQNWYKSPVGVRLAAQDNPGGSGVFSIEYRVDGGPTQTQMVSAVITTANTIVAGEGIHTIWFRSSDNARNWETPQTLTVNIDTVAPSLTALVNPSILWPPNGSAVTTVSGTVTDATSGVAPGKMTYSVADEYGLVQPRGSVIVRAGGRYSVSILLDAKRNGGDLDGRNYVITISAEDVAGNTSSTNVVVTVPHSRPR